MSRESIQSPQFTFSGVADKERPWTLDAAGRPIPIKPDQDSARVVMGSTYAFRAAAVLAEMRAGFTPVSPE